MIGGQFPYLLLHRAAAYGYCIKHQILQGPPMQPPEDASPFLRSVREAIRLRHFSIRTEEAYVHWAKRFTLFYGKRHPAEMGEREVAAFLLGIVRNAHRGEDFLPTDAAYQASGALRCWLPRPVAKDRVDRPQTRASYGD